MILRRLAVFAGVFRLEAASAVIASTPTDIADAMQEWFENGTCDGFNITPTHLPGGCEDFVELVVSELQRRGLFRTEYEGKTLRENLGLKRPVSRYAAAGWDRNLDAAK